MGTPNILLTRIDNRLVHGQVGVTWVNYLGANLLIVANDEVAHDEVRQSLMDMVVSDTVGMRYFTLQKTIDIISKASPRQKIFLVLKTPEDVLVLKQGGVPISYVNVGNMHFEEGKNQITSTVSVDDEDIAAFHKLNELGVTCEIQGVPGEHAKNIMELI
ncbi:PTS N-acetylgalactosamine transporter subunit IIB [Sporolactobacillus terrae]|uniref:PTS N-acetylgalactosamine transporter subunit IIB n=1 Tax=Sporolactobacillus terrae TaxID=269673 RepID=A0ABX5Q4R5_9BACL|nr:PTS N-acetylgalactosamine transporter subunit IIB [Sporolactobacillus terrae]QAA21619.1 PTS N-acetylgalactosamine transporter subunit IIB [Sporolactobacillus terrae]QAA24591.1 PTS N-acetylgalactosamine transporter subunit IIB [Sporolactobacillus terrae]UAK16428.1 PTS N-acetylgalactosamine transporter subunit IIB [Sporolactobacillus terrae]